MKKVFEGYYTRNAKFFGIKKNPEFEKSLKDAVAFQNKLSVFIKNGLNDGTIVYVNKGSKGEDKPNPGIIGFSDGTNMTDTAFTKHYCGLVGIDIKGKSKGARSLVQYVCNRYAGYKSRNGEKIPTIHFKGKDYHLKDNQIRLDIENKILIATTMHGKYELEYRVSIKEQELKDYLDEAGKSDFGGNYIVKQNCIVAAIQIPFKPSYEPIGALGTDFNKSEKDRTVLSNGVKYPVTQEQLEIEKEIKSSKALLGEKDKPVSERKIRSKQRRSLRKKDKKLHKKQMVAYAKTVNEIVEYVKENKLLLCIDSVGTGQKNGTFGQDKIKAGLLTECQNQGIPYYVVPCKYTSMRCPECGHIHSDNRVNTDNFSCKECGYTEDAQLVGALNIKYYGELLYKSNVPHDDYTTVPKRRSVQQLIEKYSDQVTEVLPTLRGPLKSETQQSRFLFD
jgi:transposase